MNRLMQYIQLDRLMDHRKQKESLQIVLAPFLNLFMEKDRKWIFPLLWRLSKFTNIFTIALFTLIYIMLFLVYSYMEVIFIVGFLSVIHTLYMMNHRFHQGKIEYLYSELNFLLRLKFHGKKRFVVEKLSYEIAKECLCLTVSPLVLSSTLLAVIVPFSSVWWIWLNVVIIVFIHYFLALLLLHSLLYHHRRQWLPMTVGVVPSVIIFFILLSLLDYSPFFKFSPLDITGFETQKISARHWSMMSLLAFLLVYLAVSVTPRLISQSNICPLHMAEHSKSLTSAAKFPYEKLLMKSLQYQGRLIKFRLGSLGLTLLVAILYPWLSERPYITGSAIFVLFCYTPYGLYILLTHYLYEDLMEKKNTYATYYLQKKYNFYKFASPLVFRMTVKKTAPFTVLPTFLLVVLYHPFNASMWLGIICYSISYLLLVRIMIVRMYQLERYSIEQFVALTPQMVTTNFMDTVILFGVPVILAGPLLVLYITQQWNDLLYFGFIGLTLYIGLYRLLIRFNLKSRERDHVKGHPFE
ncbi:MAG: hypothetical protein LOD88_08855 [Novibacillus thermophilus]